MPKTVFVFPHISFWINKRQENVIKNAPLMMNIVNKLSNVIHIYFCFGMKRNFTVSHSEKVHSIYAEMCTAENFFFVLKKRHKQGTPIPLDFETRVNSRSKICFQLFRKLKLPWIVKAYYSTRIIFLPHDYHFLFHFVYFKEILAFMIKKYFLIFHS